ncbi:MAG: hypothetical protein ACFFDN_06955 [Candidatus Hodarchaeota archaeon]
MKFTEKNKKKTKKSMPYEVRTYKVYTFKNLPEKSKQLALEKHRYMHVENTNLAEEDDYLLDLGLQKRIQKKIGSGNTLFEWKTAYYDLDRNNYIQYVDLKVTNEEAFRQELGVSKETWNKVTYRFDNENKNDTELDFDAYEELNEKDLKELRKAKEKFGDLVYDSRINLRKSYEYAISDESLIDSFEANEYKFTEKGDID